MLSVFLNHVEELLLLLNLIMKLFLPQSLIDWMKLKDAELKRSLQLQQLVHFTVLHVSHRRTALLLNPTRLVNWSCLVQPQSLKCSPDKIKRLGIYFLFKKLLLQFVFSRCLLRKSVLCCFVDAVQSTFYVLEVIISKCSNSDTERTILKLWIFNKLTTIACWFSTSLFFLKRVYFKFNLF